MPPKKPNNQHIFLGAPVLILALTLWRVLLLGFNQTDLFVDEAQYWLWGQSLEFGYFSKPPMIGWVIRAFTEIGQSNDQFWVRLAGPLSHAVTAFLLMRFATIRWDRSLGAAVGLAYITVPFASVGSLVISTDSILLLFFALAFLSFHHLTQKPSLKYAIILGIAVGLGMMTKYAMIYFVLGTVLTMIFFKNHRPSAANIGLALVVAGLIMAPNLVWNSQNGFSTLNHTVENANWSGLTFKFGSIGAFFAGQFAIFGPILFTAFLVVSVAIPMTRKSTARKKLDLGWMLLFSLPILLLLIFQASQSRAYANWAVTAFIAATPLAVNFLYRHAPKWLTASLVINGTFAILLPLGAVFPHTIHLPDGRALFERVLGRADLSNLIWQTAQANQREVIVASNRDTLADLFYTLHGTDAAIFARPQSGPPAHHYVQRHTLSADETRSSLYVTSTPGDAVCDNPLMKTELVLEKTFTEGFARGETIYIYLAPVKCWQ